MNRTQIKKAKMPVFSEEELLVGNRFLVLNKIGRGSFGEIFEGVDREKNSKVAIKMESRSGKTSQLSHEYYVYRKLEGTEGIPKIFWYGNEGGYNILVIELLGRNLEQMFDKCRRRFTLKTLLMLADKMVFKCNGQLRRLEYIHKKDYVHRDIKPENFLIGPSSTGSRNLFIIDFGLAKRFRDKDTREHILYIDGKSLVGTARYASINSHMGIELSRRDDLEQLAHVLLYLNRGSLPWQGQKGRTKSEKFGKILEMKKSISITNLCKGVPDVFGKLLHYARGLRFDENPDYRYLRRMFMDVFCRHGFTSDGRFDWISEKAPSLHPQQLEIDAQEDETEDTEM
ncbi:hypothetical protein MHBO_001680 [Bonamia ostreae]|uniref:Casein kinase I n=1 Tax=Bonamia ostreae TaxID=126728 RepID=A0ABV2AJS9_9EUKA